MNNVKSTNLKAPQGIRDIANTFISIKTNEKLSKNTIKFYISKLRAYIDSPFCPDDIREVTPALINAFFWDYKKNHAPSTVFAVHNVLKIFFTQYCDATGMTNPMEKIKAPKVKTKILDPVEISDVQKMLVHCNTRNRLLVLFLLDSGLRSQELLALNVDSVDLFSGQVYVEHGKGDKSRYSYIGSKTKKVLRKYLQERKVQSEALFTTSKGERLSYSALNSVIKMLCKKAGIQPQSAHAFRRAFTLSMLRSRQVDLLTLSALLGHSNQVTLSRYAKIANVDTMEAHKRAGPVDNML